MILTAFSPKHILVNNHVLNIPTNSSGQNSHLIKKKKSVLPLDSQRGQGLLESSHITHTNINKCTKEQKVDFLLGIWGSVAVQRTLTTLHHQSPH